MEYYIKKIKKEVQDIGFYVMGEPLINSNIFKFINDANQEGIYTQFSTNGMPLGKYIDDIINCGLDQVQVAIDGITPEIHEDYRIGSDLNLILENIMKMQNRKRELGVIKPEIHIQTLVNGKNENEIDKISAFCDENGLIFRTKAMHLGRSDEIQNEMKKRGYETSIKEYKRSGVNRKSEMVHLYMHSFRIILD